jgi:hypothetical protein
LITYITGIDLFGKYLIVLNLKDNITSLDNVKEFSKNIKQFILNEQKDINHVEIQLNLSHD